MASAAAMAASLQYQKEHISDSKVPMIMASAIAWFVITYTAVAMRFISRRLSRTILKWDDWCILISLVFTTIYYALIQEVIRQGFGKHVILVKDLRLFMLLGLASEVTYCVALPIIKFSTLLLLHRIFPDKAFARTSWIVAAVILTYSIAQITCLLVQCVPLTFLWNPAIHHVHCINLSPVLIACSALNIVTDLAIFCLPMPRLWALRISIKHRIQLISMFVVGALVCIISIVRIPKLLEFSFFDATWNDVDFAVWSGYELAIATICACVPTLRPLLDCVCGRRHKKARASGSASTIFGPQTYISATYVPTPLRYASLDDVRSKSMSMTQSSRPDSRLSFAVQEFEVAKLPSKSSRNGIRVKTELEYHFQEIRRTVEGDY